MTLAARDCRPDAAKLTPTERDALLAHLPAWSVAHDRLYRELSFDDFRAAVAFVNQVADVAEEQQHHPDLAIHYNRVEVTLWTHSADGLTENDFILAARIDRQLV